MRKRPGSPSILRHIALVFVYGLIAVVGGILVPRFLPEAAGGIAIAGVILLLGAALHLWMLVTGELDRLSDRLSEMEADQRQLSKEMGKTNVVAAEMRVLQTLLKQLSAQRAAARQEPPAIAPAPPAALRAPVAAESPGRPRSLDDNAVLDIVRDALNEERVDLFLQPIVSLPQRRRRYYECFSRIRAADGTQITPEQYLGVAKREGLLAAIDNMLLFRCIQLVRRARKGHLDIGFVCNIASHSLGDARFFDEFIEFLADNPTLAQGLIFEFGQDDLAQASDLARRPIVKLANLGYRFSLDRVVNTDLDVRGLAGLGFRFVKIEANTILSKLRAVPPALDMQEFRLALDRSAIDLIVEKIESEDTLRELLDYNIDFGQGYLFGEPRLSAEAA
ncbi:MAG: EAL domain-containing protein [Proteobacteria bacterium]|nr:EAL domain-containing protein [Pseudomonadota bacterium]MBI3497490.1 EAL domain-containing protein [Pseudomonadota bacterium]